MTHTREHAPLVHSNSSAVKVPQITVVFWVIKILTTGMGEACSDWLGNTNLALAGVIGIGGFALALWAQYRHDRYHAIRYWAAVAMVAVFGTMAADVLHVILGLSYVVTTPAFAVATAVLFAVWWRSERTLSIHSINSSRREMFYWLTVLASFALGTAAGDLTAATLKLGYFRSAVLFGVAILVPLLAWRLGVSAVACFWSAYVLTRPLGASIADWLGKPPSITGLGYGDFTVTAVSLVAIIGLVLWVHRSGHGIQSPSEH